MSTELASSNPQEALRLGREVIRLSDSTRFEEGAAMGMVRVALAYKQLAVYDSSFHYFFQSYNIYDGLRNTEGKITALMNIGLLYERTGKSDSSAFYLFRALAIADSANDRSMRARVLNNVGLLMKNQGRLDEAIDYFLQALTIHEELGNFSSAAKANENLANCYLEKKDFAGAAACYRKALDVYQSQNDLRSLGRVNLNISALLLEQNHLKESLLHAEKSLEYYNQSGTVNGRAHALAQLAQVYFRMKEYKRASAFALQSLQLSEEGGNLSLQFELTQLLQQLYSEQGDYYRAYDYLMKASVIRDSLFNREKEEIISELKTKYDTEKKDQEISLMRKDRELKAQQLNSEKLLKNGFMILSLLILCLGVVLFNRFQLRRKLEKAQAIIDERRRISTDMHDDLGSGLSKIALLTQVMKQHTLDAGSKEELDKISQSAQESLEKMSEIVWSLNPKNDKLENLISYIRKFAVEYFEPTSITCKVNMPDEIPNSEMKGEQRRNVFLSVKEALHNVQKHSNASLVELSFVKKDKHGEIIIHDNGKGIDEDQLNRFGNGLQNMKQRMQSAGGYFTIENKEGTTVRLGYQLA